MHTKVITYSRLARHWWGMLSGRSYWHRAQGPGPCFRPGEVAGYFNDLSHKVHWTGPTDPNGVPLVRTMRDELVYFPTTVLQKALGHWDAWLQGRQVTHRRAFMTLADWTLAHQDARGGWDVWHVLGLQYASPYSAMAQGEGVSVLCRAFVLTGDSAFLDAADRAVALMLEPVTQQGTGRYTKLGLVLDETPREDANIILNGWIFALMGLYDRTLVNENGSPREHLSSTVNALVASLPTYDSGYWSYYDSAGSLASPFYHQLHIAQLRVLALAFPQHAAAFGNAAGQFEQQARSSVNTARAVARKAAQKVLRPPQVVLR